MKSNEQQLDEMVFLGLEKSKCKAVLNEDDPVIQTAKKMAMASEYGGYWKSKHGNYFISKEGEFTYIGHSSLIMSEPKISNALQNLE